MAISRKADAGARDNGPLSHLAAAAPTGPQTRPAPRCADSRSRLASRQLHVARHARAALVVDGGEVGADLFGLRRVEVGVERQGLLPVPFCLVEVAGGVVGGGDAVVGTGLLVPVPGLGG